MIAGRCGADRFSGSALKGGGRPDLRSGIPVYDGRGQVGGLAGCFARPPVARLDLSSPRCVDDVLSFATHLVSRGRSGGFETPGCCLPEDAFCSTPLCGMRLRRTAIPQLHFRIVTFLCAYTHGVPRTLAGNVDRPTWVVEEEF